MKPGKLPLLVLSLLILVIIFGANIFAQTTSVPKVRDHQKLVYILETALRSDIPGVVEGAIFDLIEYKSFYPQRDFSPLISALHDLALETRDSTLSYKAHLAGMYLRYGTTLENPAAFNAEDHEVAYQMASEQMTRKFLLSHATQ
jgi:hypothetical protein